MPTSNLACAPEILALVADVPHRTVLDVGPGHGKYAVLLREYVGGIERLDAAEAWRPYIDEHRLLSLYDTVIPTDVMLVEPERLTRYDVVLLIDIIEHLAKEDGLALLERIPGTVVICTPRDWFQNPEAATIWTEDHRSHWTAEEFEAMPRADVVYVNQVRAVIARLR